MASRTELMENRVELDKETSAKVRSQIGSMSYFATKTRPDIACEVNLVAQDMKVPRTGTAKAVKRIMAYLSSAVGKMLWVPRVPGNEWECFSDSDHAGNRSHGDYKSRTGVLILSNGMPVHWRSNKQPVTAMSSAAAEVVALSDTMKDMRLRVWIAEEACIMVERPVQIQVDNKAAKSFQESTNPESKLQGVFDMRWDLENSSSTVSRVNSPVASVALIVAALRLAAADSQAVRAFFIPSSMLIVSEHSDQRDRKATYACRHARRDLSCHATPVDAHAHACASAMQLTRV